MCLVEEYLFLIWCVWLYGNHHRSGELQDGPVAEILGRALFSARRIDAINRVVKELEDGTEPMIRAHDRQQPRMPAVRS